MKKKTIPTPILIELVVLAIIIALLVGVTVRNSINKNSSQGETQAEDVASDTGSESSASSSAAQPITTPESTTAPAFGGVYYYYGTQNTSEPEGPTILSFPYMDTSSGIVIGTVSSYDGTYLEDSSDEDVSGVAVIMIQNQSGSDLELVQISLAQGDNTYLFEISALPNGAIAAVQEKNRQAYPGGDFNSCAVAATEGTTFDMSADKVSVVENEDGSLEVTNISGFTIPCVRIFYKYYSEEDAAFVGGITYTAKLTELEPEQTITVNPSHYVLGYSRVVMIKTYDSADD